MSACYLQCHLLNSPFFRYTRLWAELLLQCIALLFFVLWHEDWPEVPPFKPGPLSNFGPLVIQGSEVHLSHSQYYIPWNSPNGEMDEGYIWVGSTIQTNRKQKASNRKKVRAITKIKPVWLWECTDK